MKRRFPEALPALLFLAAFLVFWRGTLEVPFQLDDEDLIEHSDVVRRPPSLFGTIVSSLRTPFGRPLATFTLQVDHALWGLDPRGFHVTALALHLGCAWLVWLLVRRGIGALWPNGPEGRARAAAWVAAGVFAFHPVQTETVAYLAARSTLLAVFLGSAGLLCADSAYLAAGRGDPWKGCAAGSVALLFASVAAMPLGLAFLPLLVAWLAWVRRVPRRALGLAAGMGALLVLFVAGDLAHFFSRGAVFRPPGYSLAYWMTQPECLLRGIGKILMPQALTLDYDIMPVGIEFAPGGTVPAPGLADGKVVLPFEGAPEGAPEGVVFSREPVPGTGMKPRFAPVPFEASFPGVLAAARDPRFWGACLATVAAASAAVFWARRRLRRGDAASARAAAFGAALFLLGWLPAAGAPLEDLFFEHHLYLSLAGAAWGAGVAAARFPWGGGAARPPWSAAAAAVFLAWGLLAAHRTGTWSRKDAIWADSVRASPGKPRPRFNLATMWHESRRGPPERLRQMCVNASVTHVRFRDNANLLAEIPNLLGGIHQWMGQYELAHFFYQDAVRRMPVSRAFRSNLAGSARCLGRHEEAAALYAGLLRERPEDPATLTLLAEEFAAMDRLAEAREILERLLVTRPGDHAAAVDLAAVLVQQGDLDAAVSLYRAVAGRFRSAPLLYNLATALLRGGRAAEAREAFLAALAVEPSFTPAHAALRRMAGR